MAKVRAPSGLSLSQTSMCDHDLYSGAGNEDEQPFLPTRTEPGAADGLWPGRRWLCSLRLATSPSFFTARRWPIGPSVAYASELRATVSPAS